MKTMVGIVLMWGLLMAVRYGLVAAGVYGIPAAIAALGVMTLLIIVIKPVADFMEDGAGTLLEYMPLFFIPVLVGVMVQQGVIAQHWFLIIFTVVGSSLIGLLSAAYIYRFVSRRTHRDMSPSEGHEAGALDD